MSYFISRGRQQFGQYSEDDIQYGLADGKFLITDLGWQKGMEEWKPLSEIISARDPLLPPRSAKPVAIPYKGKPVYEKKRGGSVGMSGFAVVAMLLGLISLVVYYFLVNTTIAAELFGQIDMLSQTLVYCYLGAFIYIMLFGHRALIQINKSKGQLRGKALAMSGIFMGYFLFILLTPTTVAMALPVIENTNGLAINIEGPAKIRSINKAETLVAACLNYALKNNGVFPINLQKLVDEKYIQSNKELIDPLSRETPKSEYEYLGEGMKESDAADAIVLRSQPKKNGKRVIARKDGSVIFGPSSSH